MIQNPFSKKSLLAAAFGAALVLPSVPVFALAINPLAPANGFDVFVKNDLTLVRTEGEGALAAGHNLNLALQGNYQIGSNIKSPYKIGGSTVSLVVGNQVNLSSGNIAYVENGNQVRIGNLGNVKVWEKDLNNASMNTRITKPSASPDGTPRLELRTKQSAASIASDSGIDFTTAFTSLEANAQALSKIAPTGALPGTFPADGKITFNLTAGQANVFDLTATQLASITEIKFSLTPSLTTPVLFNITSEGKDIVWNPKFAGIGDSQASFILFNFYDAKGSITIGSGGSTSIGAILAPDADIYGRNNSNITGQVIAKSFYHDGGELHDSPFTATFEVPPPPKVPDTGSTLVLLASSLLFLEVLRRRVVA